jgi:hypothetical protein
MLSCWKCGLRIITEVEDFNNQQQRIEAGRLLKGALDSHVRECGGGMIVK